MDYKLLIVFLLEVFLLAELVKAEQVDPPIEQMDDTVEGVPPTYNSSMLDYMSNNESVKAYLEQFGYMGERSPDPQMANMSDPNVTEKALERFQNMAGIPVTGKMDNDTIKMMMVPRCGMPDNVTAYDSMKRRRKRYALQGSKWRNNRLSYRIINSASSSSVRNKVPAIMVRAFRVWSDVANINFRRSASRRADIQILFARRGHGDGSPFDGLGRTLAHAFFPQYGGDAHFDDDEPFTDGTRSGINLFQVAAHEFGHSLGLRHSEVRGALMQPFYPGYQPNFRLHPDEIAGIQRLYGQKNSVSTPRPIPPGNRTESCESRIDAIASTSGLTLAFVGRKYYHINIQGPLPGYPRTISVDFNGVTSVDAAYAKVKSRRTFLYLFKGSQVHIFQYRSGRFQILVKRAISRFIPGLPSNIDALFKWPRTNKIYVFKGNQYYRLLGNTIERKYPRPLRVWRLPRSVSRVTAAVQYRRRTYFFVGNQYYRFNDRRIRVATARPSYPRNVGRYWFRCGSYSDGQTVNSPGDNDFDDNEFDLVQTAEELSLDVTDNGTTLSVIHASTHICVFMLSLLITRWL